MNNVKTNIEIINLNLSIINISKISIGDLVRIKLTSFTKRDRMGVVIDLVNDKMDCLVLLQDGALFVDRMCHFRKL